ncbi:MAG TPA: ISNCY family transposase [Gemmataceae bacterium]|nr:ISNCY family transposase [Gemmataceae bacterium]
MSQWERDRLRVLHSVLDGQRTQVEGARLLRLTPRHVRRLLQRLQEGGDAALVHGLRGQPSNHRKDAQLHRRVLQVYRKDYPDFGPTFAAEKLAERGLEVSPDTLRRWLLAEGLWQPQRRREQHRSRRPRRACLGELVQMDTSIHDWTEGRGEDMVLIHMIDDATSRLLARFYGADTVLNHMDLLWRWLQVHGRPLALYTDRHSIFEPQNKGQALPGAETQFGRALRELRIELIRARSPQAKGRVERSFGTAQDRVVKEMRLAKVKTIGQANALLDGGLLAKHNRLFSVPPREAGDGHRALGSAFNVAAILSLQEQRTVANDYTVRFENHTYQLDKPIYPGERGGKVVIETRLDRSMAIRFREHYLKYHEIASGPDGLGGAAPQTPRSLAPWGPTPGDKEGPASVTEAEPSGAQPTVGRSGRTSAEPYPPDGAAEDSKKGPHRPAADHPWRRGFRAKQKD